VFLQLLWKGDITMPFFLEQERWKTIEICLQSPG
jgi:hypothetical protein